MTAEELFEEDITEVEEKVGGGLNGTISKKICGEGENGNGALRTFGSMATGIAIGILMSFFFSWKFGGGRKGNDEIPSSGISMKTIHRGKMKGMQTLSTADSDPEMEII
jgi:hypothetical protein